MATLKSQIVIFAALGGNALIAVTKFAAAWFTGSSAMLSEGLHSLVEIGNYFLLLFGLRQAATGSAIEHSVKSMHPDVIRVFIKARSFEAHRRAFLQTLPT